MRFSSNAQNFNLAKFEHYKGISSFLSHFFSARKVTDKLSKGGNISLKESWCKPRWHKNLLTGKEEVSVPQLLPPPTSLTIVSYTYEINLIQGNKCCWIRQSLGLFFCSKVAAGRPFYCMAFIIHATGLTCFFTASCSMLKLPQVGSGWTRYLTSTPQWVSQVES